jgi:hypothetical protein
MRRQNVLNWTIASTTRIQMPLISSWIKFDLLLSFPIAGTNPDEVIGFFNWPNISSRTMALGLTQPLIEMNIRNHPGGKGRPARKADNLIAICEPIV